MNPECTANGNPVTHLLISNENYETNQKVSLIKELEWGLVEIEFLNGNRDKCEPSLLLKIETITNQ